MKKPEDYWDEDLSWIKCYWDTDIDEIVDRLAGDMKLVPCGGTDEEHPAVQARDVFTSEDMRSVKALYHGVLHGCLFCGAFKDQNDAVGRHIRSQTVQVALNCAEFAFLKLHPDYNSYDTFYLPIKHVVDYMHNHWDELEEEDERRHGNA